MPIFTNRNAARDDRLLSLIKSTGAEVRALAPERECTRQVGARVDEVHETMHRSVSLHKVFLLFCIMLC